MFSRWAPTLCAVTLLCGSSSAQQWGPWHAVGPFEHILGHTSLDERHEPERQLSEMKQGRNGPDLGRVFRGEGHIEARWHEVAGGSAAFDVGPIHFKDCLPAVPGKGSWENYSAAYLYRKAVMNVDRDVRVHMGSDDGVMVWLNGTLVLERAGGVGPPRVVGGFVTPLMAAMRGSSDRGRFFLFNPDRVMEAQRALEAVTVAVDLGADLEACRADGRRPIHVAIDGDYWSRPGDLPKKAIQDPWVVVNYLLDLGAELDLGLHCMMGDVEQVAIILAADPTAGDRLDSARTSPLYRAARAGQMKVVDLLLSYEPQGRHKGWKGLLKLSSELQELNFDAAILFYPRPELAFALLKAKIPLRIGTGYRWYSFLLNRRIYEHRKDCRKHESEYNLSLLESLMPDKITQPHYEFKQWTPEPWWDDFQTELKSKDYVILHSGCGASAPNLNEEQYKLIIRLLLEKTDWTVLLTGVSGEENVVNALAADFPEERVKKTVGRFSLAELFTVIRNASLLITSSTGPLHLANAAGTPLLGFFCPAKPHTPTRWGPYDQQQWVVTPNLDWPEICELKNCPHGGCLNQLSDDEITEILCTQRLKTIHK